MLKRNKPLLRKTPLKRSTKPIARTPLKRSLKPIAVKSVLKRNSKPIAKKSDTQKKRDALYYPERKAHLEDHPECQLRHPGICTYMASEIHHSAGKAGELYWTRKYFKSACRACHDWAHDNVKAAKKLGYSVDRLDK